MPKAKQKAKKTTKAKVKTEWDDLDLSTLEQRVATLKAQQTHALEERIRIQTEYEAVVSYRNVTKSEIDALEDEIRLKNYSTEQDGKDYFEEYRMYAEKVNQLNYDFKRKVELNEARKDNELQIEDKECQEHLKLTECKVLSTQEELRERQIVNTEQIKQEKGRFDEEVTIIEKKLSQDLQALVDACAQQEISLNTDLGLKRLVELRALTEQMNLHLSRLEQKHEELYVNTRTQYSNTSDENCTKIGRLEDQTSNVLKEINILKDRSEIVQEENDRLSGPLSEMISKINMIKTEIKDKDKNRQYLLNIKSRKILVLDRIEQQEKENLKLRNQFDEMKGEHDILERELEQYSNVALDIAPGKNNVVQVEIENAVFHLQAFQEANRVSGDDTDGSKQHLLKDGPSLEELAMETQRAFNKAIWRLKSELKSAELGKQQFVST